MALQFIIGGSGSGKSRYIYQKILEQAKHDDRQYLILVPDQFTMQTQKDLCTFPENDREGIMNIDVLSFSRLSHRIMEEVGQKQGILLDDTGKNLVLRRVAGEKKDELTVIGANLKKIGYIHEVKSMISEFYQYDIGDKELEQLIEHSKKKGALAYKLKDLQILRKAFADYIRDKYITTEELLEQLCQVLPKSEIVRNSVVVLDGFTGFTPIQNKLVRQLMTLSSEMIVSLAADGVENVRGIHQKEELFYLSHKTYGILSKIAEEEGVEKAEDVVLDRREEFGGNVARFKNNFELGFLERNLFRGGQSYDGEVTKIHIGEAANPREEIQALLCQIQSLIRTEGYSYRDIAVVAGNMADYGHLLKTEFDYYGVPLYMDQTRGILFHPMSEFLRAMLEIFLNDFNQDSVMRFLRTSLTGLTREETDRLEIYITRFGIRGGKSYGRLFTKGADSYTAEEMIAINESRQKMMELLSPLTVLMDRENEAQHVVRAVYDICVAAGLQGKMEYYREKFESEENLAKAREYAQVYKAVIDLLDQMHALLMGEKITLQEFARILEAGLGEITIGTIPQNVDQVVAGDIERTRLKQVRALFFIGVNDGAVPKGHRGGGLLSDMEREFLSGLGYELAPTPREQVFMQCLYLYLNMTKPSEQLFLSFARVNHEGKGIHRSYLIGTMQKLFPGLRITDFSKCDVFSRIAGKADGLDDLAALFSKYAAGLLENRQKEKETFFALADAYWREGAQELVTPLKEAAFYTYEPHSLPKEIAKALYGEIVESSVGRLELFSACAYAHFLQYGMKLKEQGEYEIDDADIGNIYHEVMKRFSEYLREKGWHWADFPLDEADLFVDETVKKLAKEYENAIFYSSADNLYATTDMAETLKRSIRTLRYHLAKGMFEPRSFEVPFYLGDKIKTKGRIDRIDTFTKDNELYVKVVDYKSGKNGFDPVEFYFGLKMQLAVYLKAAVLLEEKKHTGKEVIPAALVYYQFQNPYVDMEQGESADVEEKIREKMKITGLVSEEETVLLAMDREFEMESDIMPVKRKKDGSFYKNSITATREQLHLLMDYVDDKVREVGERVYGGEITINPYEKKDGDACEYCAFGGVCHYDGKIEGYQKRRLDEMEPDKAWEKIAEAVNDRGEKHGD